MARDARQEVTFDHPLSRELDLGDELERFRSEGHSRAFRILPREAMSTAARVVESVIARQPEDRDAFDCRHLDSPEVLELCLQPRVVAAVRGLLGPRFVLWRSYLFLKSRDAASPEPLSHEAIPWHQDAEYWPSGGREGVSCWFALDDANLENGCMEVVPGSHRQRFDHVPLATGRFAKGVDEGAVEPSRAVAMELSAGEAFLFDPRLLHRSGPNRSPMRRLGLTARFAAISASFDGFRPFPSYRSIAVGFE